MRGTYLICAICLLRSRLFSLKHPVWRLFKMADELVGVKPVVS
jgi:hypothetical protein